ncbi:hypothetical protein M011DRAFT_192546 [Sporormia fimetaria CBS 119925]|uniref:Uncharacterized protein n=1 Tax=Sporormia fimetaria CBS 119925 TaxID=1340428 RepID=A0A6A6V2G3_9PLEO|nr:hypothetical protein M011DRAFT_192546 [Sporormia fimetaria CBS 119925]
MATVVARTLSAPSRSSSPPHLTLNTTPRGAAVPIPNKHIPTCSPGPAPSYTLQTPPSTPPSNDTAYQVSSITYPPHAHCRPLSEANEPPIYAITGEKLSAALEHLSSQPLPPPEQVFPWLHGLHAQNQTQLQFFISRRTGALRRVPRCIRSITVVKAGGDLSTSRVRGAISPDELLNCSTFHECDPKDGFSVRNFQIQTCKLAMVSDIVVYGDDRTHSSRTNKLASTISKAQRKWEAANGLPNGTFNTFVLTDTFAELESKHPELIAIDSCGNTTRPILDFCYWERYEMCTMSRASEISSNVFLGPTPDPMLDSISWEEEKYDLLVEASDIAHVPDSRSLTSIVTLLDSEDRKEPVVMEFPSSGSIMPPSWSHAEVDGLMETCKTLYALANPTEVNRKKRRKNEEEGTIELDEITPARKILIHCADGYTESSLLALTYYMYAEGVPAHEAWVQLHRDKGRNFFAYQQDALLLMQIQPRILSESPNWHGDIFHMEQPRWAEQLDGSLPSRILPYMYLGNLNHANNPELLRELGITRVLSVGESITWPEDVRKKLNWPSEKLMVVNGVQDNGVDPLWDEFERCLAFLAAGKAEGGATLVHCRVGVSRSATICIAEVMNTLGLSFPRAYCFVRARRLNVIIQPHLRFTYELLKWEEYQRIRRNLPLRREMEWASVAREIALMNKPYSR